MKMTRRHRNLKLNQLTVLAVLSTAVLPGATAIEDLDPEDVPPECALACAPITQLTERCEAAAEQQLGAEAVNRRWATGKQRRASAVDGGNGGPDRDVRRGRRRQRGARRSLQRMSGSRLDRRQEEDDGKEDGEDSSEDSDDSDDSDSDQSDEEEEEEEEENPPVSENAAETGGSEEAAAEANQEAAVEAMRACVCEETGFDVAVAASGCAACIAQNATAADADEDIRQIMAECGFITTAFPSGAVPTQPPILAPAESGTDTSPPPSPASPTMTSFPPAVATTTTQGPDLESITPVTVFETPSFSALPPLVLPNDISSTPPVLEQNENQLSGAARGLDTAFGGWLGRGVVFAVVVGLISS